MSKTPKSYRPCKSGQVRNPLTKRCKKVKSATKTHKASSHNAFKYYYSGAMDSPWFDEDGQTNSPVAGVKRALDNTTPFVKSVTFDIGRFGKNQHIIHFKKMVTLKKAVNAAEAWLSKPISTKMFKYLLMMDDLYTDDRSDYIIRGDALGGATFLEGIRMGATKHDIVLVCAS